MQNLMNINGLDADTLTAVVNELAVIGKRASKDAESIAKLERQNARLEARLKKAQQDDKDYYARGIEVRTTKANLGRSMAAHAKTKERLADMTAQRNQAQAEVARLTKGGLNGVSKR